MHLILTNAPLITPVGIREEPLTINLRTGKIIAKANRKAIIIDLDGLMLLPGLVNAHDHLELNHFPRSKFRETYPNAHQWGDDFSARLEQSPFRELRAYSLQDRCLSGGVKNLLSGVTTVAHHNPFHPPLASRNFPIRVLRRYGWAHSLHFESSQNIQRSFRKTPRQAPWMVHVAEGTDEIAQQEYRQLDALGVVSQNTVFIHGVGLTSYQTQQAIQKGASLVWCPSTNHYLLNKTAPIDQWIATGQIGLGSDSRLTANGDLLDELKVAAAYVDPQKLFHLVTDYPRRFLGISETGNLQVGRIADLIALPYAENPYKALVNVHRADLSFVMRKGKILIGSPNIVQKFPCAESYSPIEVDGQLKWMVTSLVEQLRHSQIAEPGVCLEGI